ncbi:hypothetical protein MHLP_03100 [Candidatus Mycoplasma haematolamae str. Purdue]|uniref:Uncharacterized protein n=1 Tax=Mycoplasma haematolamae (strain Purdue) TaxID=1212765 RepID=I7BA82_MYCHA|nr:hypothetical protein [Candidatus Mycoplasma haematolamae]AFO52200.1 hypothetical protein MHLP_03100 [Candidatus Mycoplasma haematolamae str. Purdue]
MLYPKYVVSLLAVLSGGVNTLIFNPYSSVSVEGLDQLTSIEKTHNSLNDSLEQEQSRLKQEGSKREATYTDLKTRDSKNQQARADTDKSKGQLQEKQKSLEEKTKSESERLKKEGETITEQHPKEVQKITEAIQRPVESYFQGLQGQWTAQQKVLEEALKKLQDANKERIQELTKNLETLTNQVFQRK